MEAKKISFGFSKINKRPNIIVNKETSKTEAKVELIKCLEGQEIKLVEEKPEEKPLIIPLKKSQKTSAALASLIKRRAVLLGEEEPMPNNTTDEQKEQTSNLNNINVGDDLEKRAAQELLAEVQSNGLTDTASTLVLPVVKPDDLPLEGAKESTLDDYEEIPIQDFGKAMLRGMGWVEPTKTNKKGGPPLDETPMVRPKGMGLGADKALNKKPLLVAPEANEVLEVKRNAYVRILGGKHKDLYGQIEGFDDHAGRVIVKMAIGGNKEAFNEFLCQPVSRKEYAQYGKCINTSKYEEYKKRENEYGQIILNDDEMDSIAESHNIKSEKKLKTEKRSPGKSSGYGNEKNYVKKEYERYHGRYNNENSRERDTEYKRNRDTKSYDKNYTKRYADRGRPKEDSRERESRRDYRKDDGLEGRSSETDRYDSRNDNYRGREHSSQKNYRDYNKTTYTDKQHERNRNTNVNRRERYDNSKVIDVKNSSSESENDAAHSSKYTKSKKKSSKTKSKKSKGRKSNFPPRKESSSSGESSSDVPEAKSKEHSRKLKKSKKQRTRSITRSRSRTRS